MENNENDNTQEFWNTDIRPEYDSEALHGSAPVQDHNAIQSVDAYLEITEEGKHMPKDMPENMLRRMHSDVAKASDSFSRLERYRSNMGKLIREIEQGMNKTFGMSQDALHESAIRYQILDDTDLF